jgi:hypothetical protein
MLMAEEIQERESAPAGTVTETTPAKADETSAPVPNDAKLNDPPVRTNRPDVPIADSLAAGAGAHEARWLNHVTVVEEPVGDGKVSKVEVAVDENGLDADGRFVGEPVKPKKAAKKE